MSYIPKGLSEADKKKQKKQLEKSKQDYKKGKYTERKDLKSFKERPSSFVQQVKKKTGLPINFDKLADKLTRTKSSKNSIGSKASLDKREKQLLKGFEEIYQKGKGAYYSSGSRPNQTPESWGKGRLASVLVGGPSRKIDKAIVKKYNIPLL